MAGRRARRARRPQRALLIALLGGVAAGAGLFVGGALAAREAATEEPGGARQAGMPDADADTTVVPTTPASLATTTSTTAPVAPTTTIAADPADDGTLSLGERGDEVGELQARLSALGYWLGTPDGAFGQLTRQAVMAFQKAEGLHRDGVAGSATLAALATAVRPAPHDPTGSHIEIDLARQILLVVEDGHTRWVLNTSTGNGEAYVSAGGGSAIATTPPGSFVVQREIDGLRRAPLGNLYRPKYFNGGIAIHGAGEIPAQPASHGCARVTNAAMDLLWSTGVTAIGTTVLVY